MSTRGRASAAATKAPSPTTEKRKRVEPTEPARKSSRSKGEPKTETENEAQASLPKRGRPTTKTRVAASKPRPVAKKTSKAAPVAPLDPNIGSDSESSERPVKRAKTATFERSLPQRASHPRPPRLAFVFGNGDMGQFGLGTTTLGDIARPRLHAWFKSASEGGVLGGENAGVEKICAGGMHSLAIDEFGRIWSWGINDNASLGRPTTNIPEPENAGETIESEILETQPMLVQTLVDEGFRAVDVAAGDSISVAISETGELRAWGSFRSSDGLLGFTGLPLSAHQSTPVSIEVFKKKKTAFVSIACGNDHVVALTNGGRVWCFGNGQQAQLGRKIIERRKAHGLDPERLALKKIVAIGSGSFHSFAVQQDGTVWAWGLNSLHQTGVQMSKKTHTDIIATPMEVETLSPESLGGSRKVVAVSGGEHHSLFLLSDGSVWGCGRCDGFELGLPDDHPAMKDILEARKARLANGDNDKPPADEFIPEPVPLIFPPAPTASDPAPPLPPYASLPDPYTNAPSSPISYISAGTRHNLAVSVAGDVYSWGYGNTCQLGLGPDVESANVPTRVRSKAMDGWKVETAAAGGQHCLLLATKRE